MAIKGSQAKQSVVETLREAFGENFLGENAKKYYVRANDGGNEYVQIAITLTCVKNEIETFDNPVVEETKPAVFDWGTLTPATPNNNGLSDAENENIRRLKRMLEENE